MKLKTSYTAPVVVKVVPVVMGGDLLAESVVDKLTVKSTGQEVEIHDFTTDPAFSHEWE